MIGRIANWIGELVFVVGFTLPFVAFGILGIAARSGRLRRFGEFPMTQLRLKRRIPTTGVPSNDSNSE